MSDDNDIVRIMRALDRRIGQTEVKEVPLYTEGAWTPAFLGSGTAGVFTYTAQTGYYTRINNLIFLRAFIAISAIGTPPTGNMAISGLPFANSNVINGVVDFGYIDNFNYTNTAFALLGLVVTGATTINLYESFDNAAIVQVPAANFTNAACSLVFTGQYQISP